MANKKNKDGAADDTRSPDEPTNPQPVDANAEGVAGVDSADSADSADGAGGERASDGAAAALSDSDQGLLDQAATDLVAEMRSDMLRAQAELHNFRTRVERDRTANREAVIAEVIRSLLPALDDLALAEAHGDLGEGAPMTIVAQKLRAAFEKYGLTSVGVKGEPFDPAFHEAVVQLPNPEVTVNTIADVIAAGYVLGDRLVRPAKVAVFVPTD